MINGKNIHLRFDDKIILENFDIHASEGEHLCLSGPSGSGKSSILRLLQGYVQPQIGHIEVMGLELNAYTVQDIRRSMIWIPQNIHLPVDNGLELLDFLALQHRKQEALSLLQQMGLEEEFINKRFDEISGGQKQRVVMSVCLAMERPVILMDEPTSALDDESIDRLIACLGSLSGKTIISASHHQHWVQQANKVVRI